MSNNIQPEAIGSNPRVSGDTPGGGGGRGFSRGRRNNRGGGRQFARGGKPASAFKGETLGMNGSVFQTQEESKDPTQFKRTMEALERFVNKTYNVDMRSLFEAECTLPTVVKPGKPTDTSDVLEMEEFREEVKQFVKDRKVLEKSLRSLFAVIWGQCSMNIVSKLLSLEDLETWKETGRCDELIKGIQQIMMRYDHQKCAYVMLFRQLRYFYGYRQKENQTLHAYYEVFLIMKENISRYGGNFGDQKAVIKSLMEKDNVVYETATDDELKHYAPLAREKFLATAFLLGGRLDTYGNLVTDLENDFLKGHDSFPNSVSESYHLMANYVQRRTGSHNNRGQMRNNGLGFLQSGSSNSTQNRHKDPVPGSDGKTHPNVECWRCKSKGHYSNKCPVALFQTEQAAQDPIAPEDNVDTTEDDVIDDTLGFGFLNVSFTLMDGHRYNGLNDDWVLLDTQSNCDIFKNPRLLTNIRKHDGAGLVLQSNGGEMYTDYVGDVKGYGTVWFNPSSLANILSFANVRKQFKVTMNTGPLDPSPTIMVHKRNGKPMCFREHAMGLYVHQSSNDKVADNDTLNDRQNYSFLSTDLELEREFTKREVLQAKLAKALYVKLGRPSQAAYLHLVKNHLLHDCPITVDDVKRYYYIYGKDSAYIKGHAVRNQPRRVDSATTVPIPSNVLQWHMDVELCVDIFFVQGLVMLHTVSRKIHFRTVEELPSRSYKHILSGLQRVFNLYLGRGFNVLVMRADLEFQSFHDTFLPTTLELASKGEHVPEIERSIRTVKENIRSIIHGLPFRFYTRLMIRSLTYLVVKLINSFPSQSGISTTVSPLSIVVGRPPPKYSDFALEFGQYVQVHDVPSITNTTAARTTGAIALLPSNSHGGYRFMSLTTGKQVTRYSWTSCILSNDIIEQVHALAQSESTTEMDTDDLITLGDEHVPGDNEGAQHDNFDYTEANETAIDNANTDATGPIGSEDVADEDLDLLNDNNNENDDQENIREMFDAPETINEEIRSEITEETAVETENETNTNERMRSEATNNDAVEENRSEDPEEANIDEEVDYSAVRTAEIPVNTGDVDNEIEERRYNLRRRVRRTQDANYNKQHFNFLSVMKNNLSQRKRGPKTAGQYMRGVRRALKDIKNGKNVRNRLEREFIGFCLTQMSANKGIKTFGERALVAMAKEYAQLHDLQVFTPRHSHELSAEERRSSLNVIDLIKEKRCGKIKGRTVVDGRGQRGKYTKAQTSSSALTVEAFISTLAIDAHEGREVAITDIAGAYLKAHQPDVVIIRMKGPAVDAILRVDEKKYGPYVRTIKGVKTLYMQLLRAMYGTLTAAILWYEMFAKVLLDMDFQINAYDTCLLTRSSMASNLPYAGMLMTSNCPIKIKVRWTKC